MARRNTREEVIVALHRTADEHDQRATLLDADNRPERAAWHRNAARVNRVRADKIERDARAG